MKRRNFIKVLGAAGVLTGTSSSLYPMASPSSPLRILVLGGRDFLGPAIVKAGIDRGHNLTLFNRGITNPQLFADLPLVKGDRDKGSAAYEILKQQQWDIVIDVWPQKSDLVKEATAALQNNAGHYIFISSVSVYSDFSQVGLTESTSLVSLPDLKEEWGYPEEKVAAEDWVSQRFPNNHTILRPGPIKGYRDPAYDLLYWLIKLQRNESILAGGPGDDPLQFIDAADVGRFAIIAAENKIVGPYNCVGPREQTLTWRDFLVSAKSHLNSSSEIHWVTPAFLEKNNVRPWDDLPLFTPKSYDAFMQISNAKSVVAGFEYTPLDKTIDACLDWHASHGNSDIVFGPGEGEAAVGLERSRELALIAQVSRK